MKNALIFFIGLIFCTSSIYAFGGKPAASDPIAEKTSSWTGRALSLQRQLDIYAPMHTNSILGTHNSYNSRVYKTPFRYVDPQQKHSIYDQLRLGARFIELDAHWTWKWDKWQLKQALLLCHSGIGVNILGSHLGCSKKDKYVAQGVDEINRWLMEPGNEREVIIIYVEDHTDGRHQELYDVINQRIGSRVYHSGGCKGIPDSLTKANVINAGKQVILHKDGGCSGNQSIASMVFTDLGKLSRVWEDATVLAPILDILAPPAQPVLDANTIRTLFKRGINLLTLDNLTHNDGRLEAAVWSWDTNEPNNYFGREDCAIQWNNGRWNDTDCNQNHAFACYQGDTNSWLVTGHGEWLEGDVACASLGAGYEFSMPTNSQSNEALRAAKDGSGTVWLNYHDLGSEGTWEIPKLSRSEKTF